MISKCFPTWRITTVLYPYIENIKNFGWCGADRLWGWGGSSLVMRGGSTLGRIDRFPLGYSFLGNEPDSVVCCDLDDCQLPMQSLDYKRLNCGHSFHLSCLRDRERGQNRSNQVDPTRLCPICHPLLEARIRELSTTMNRLVPNQIMLSLNDS